MRKYYIYYPRNFENEYTVFGAATAAGMQLAERMRTEVECSWDFVWRRFRRISASEARRLCGRGENSGGYIDLDVMAQHPGADYLKCLRLFG